VVTTFGRYDRTMNPGIGFTWPAPISRVEMVGVEEIREFRSRRRPQQGKSDPHRRSERDRPGLYGPLERQEPAALPVPDPRPEQTIREVPKARCARGGAGELEDALGAGRGEIEGRWSRTCSSCSTNMGSGIQIQGVAVNQSQPPTAIVEAFNEVLAAQQKAQSEQNNARAYALQLTARAQGDAAQFEQLYQQYRLAPGGHPAAHVLRDDGGNPVAR
jgi:membrane protease subunit HflK